VVAGANIGDDFAVFESVHGSAPDIAGRSVANPMALIRSAEMMMGHLGEAMAARSIRQGLIDTLSDERVATPDLGGSASTMEFANAVADRVASLSAVAK
jgi:isocitrate dehydrogenase (NAD+)